MRWGMRSLNKWRGNSDTDGALVRKRKTLVGRVSVCARTCAGGAVGQAC